MRTFKIEVVSENEAIELCKSNGYKFVKVDYIDDKFVLTAQEQNTIEVSSKIDSVDKGSYVVYAVINTNVILYVAQHQKAGKSVTFNKSYAKTFTKKDAELKAHCMTITGKRHFWRVGKR